MNHRARQWLASKTLVACCGAFSSVGATTDSVARADEVTGYAIATVQQLDEELKLRQFQREFVLEPQPIPYATCPAQLYTEGALSREDAWELPMANEVLMRGWHFYANQILTEVMRDTVLSPTERAALYLRDSSEICNNMRRILDEGYRKEGELAFPKALLRLTARKRTPEELRLYDARVKEE